MKEYIQRPKAHDHHQFNKLTTDRLRPISSPTDIRQHNNQHHPPSSFNLYSPSLSPCLLVAVFSVVAKDLAARARSIKKNALVVVLVAFCLYYLCTFFFCFCSMLSITPCDNEIIPRKRIAFRAEVTKENKKKAPSE
jgi:hypothetical protein